MILLLPGLFAAVMASGNIHIGSILIVTSGNFIFYFGVAYLGISKSGEAQDQAPYGVGR